ncbi:hypothetical protein ESB00_08030 [Oleiharenicola lentus]|jgi:hypothetical protein|uniref:Uncharacterized protein n=1 Tax=Oleiharenicola lentus TaxID=2508720 RepID=A0A4Q1CAD5_9BACT|nr:hypothetical protein [Oleiharenicola lentus]RXK55822.1 hypothetical protein ESB00_08030 [Oleiharenicola lentus]
MKTIHHLTSALVAAGSTGVALLTVSGHLPSELGLASLTVAGLLGFALFDYARPTKSLRAPLAPVLRPALPAAPVSRRVAAVVEKAA